jgi:ATP-dependent RNA circularization protein (DNA/RNA ligase family)
MQFHKYNSIENSYRNEFIQQIVRKGHGDKTYVVQEKAHGANLCLITNGREVTAARRSGLIP